MQQPPVYSRVHLRLGSRDTANGSTTVDSIALYISPIESTPQDRQTHRRDQHSHRTMAALLEYLAVHDTDRE